MKFRKALTLLALAAAPMASINAQAVWGTSVGANLTGSRTLPDVVIGGNWDGFLATWNITQEGLNWRYVYTFTSDAPAISHLILGLTSTCTTASTSPTASTCLKDASFEGSEMQIGTFGVGSGNPGFPAGNGFWGVKFDETVPGSGNVLNISFLTDRAPVWGDFYAKGGNDSYAFNEGLLAANRNSDDIMMFIARPNGNLNITSVPEPSTYVLMAAGLAGLGIAARRRRRS
jgi:hypothetical protein